MTTSLITGMKYPEAVDAIGAAAAAALRPSDRIALWTEVGEQKVLVGIAQPGKASFVMEVDRAEYSGLQLAGILAVDLTPSKDPLKAAQEATMAMREPGKRIKKVKA